MEGIVTFEACTKCPTGTWSNRTGQDEMDDCVLCDRGRYRNLSGGVFPMEDCFKCPPGRSLVTTDKGTTGCNVCDGGHYQALEGQTSCNICPL